MHTCPRNERYNCQSFILEQYPAECSQQRTTNRVVILLHNNNKVFSSLAVLPYPKYKLRKSRKYYKKKKTTTNLRQKYRPAENRYLPRKYLLYFQ